LNSSKKILIFQTGEPIHLDDSNAPMRLINLANFLVKKKYKVEIITSQFFHQEKKFRDEKILLKKKIKDISYRFIKSTGYNSNISFKRLVDHIILAKNLKKELKNIDDIDHVFMGYPPIECCYVLARWCVKKKIPYTVDYKDLWPELFLNNKSFLFKILLYPLILFLKYIRNYTLVNSSNISTISEKFLSDLNIFNLNQKKIVCYLTKEKLSNINLQKINKDLTTCFQSKKIKIIFVGNFMTDAFNFEILKKLEDFIINSPNIEFFFFGTGPSKNKIKDLLNFKNIKFFNRVNSHEFQYIMENSQAVFLPINNRFDYLKSIPNKIVDAVQYNLPIFTSLMGEAKFLIQKYNIGFVYNNENELKDCLKWFASGSNYNKIKKNYNSSDIKKAFDHNQNYNNLVNKIKNNLKN